MSHTVFIAIGSNMESPAANCRQAMDRLAESPGMTLLARSSLYRSEPFGKTDQDWFVNAVVRIDTSLSPEELLQMCQSIEQEMGRTRSEKWGPRIIDLDILFYDDLILKREGLEIPHPGIPGRSFVLVPMNEIAPDSIHPQLKKPVKTLLEEIENPQQVQRMDSDG